MALWQRILWRIVILDVTIKRSDAPRATVPEENGRASADIKYGDEQASLKFCKDAESSAMNQTNPGYGDQHRIVPSDQLDDAKDVLTGSAQKNRLRGREDAAAQQEKHEICLMTESVARMGRNQPP